MSKVDDPDGLFAAAGAVAELVVRTSVIRETSKRQQSLLENVEASIEAVRQRADTLAEGSRPLADLAVDTRQLAKAGAELLGGVVGDLDLAVSTAQACLEQLSELTSRVAEIGKFASSIYEVSRQTKMIALNAAIEAARAGEHGRGFSVVADEVGRLSTATAQATAKISATVSQVGEADARSATSRGRLADSVESLQVGLDAAREATDVFDRIATQVDDVAAHVVEMSDRCSEQLVAADTASADARMIGLAARSTTDAVQALAQCTGLVGGATDSFALAGLAGIPGAGPAAGALRNLVAVLRPLFDVPRAHAGAFVALSSDLASRGMPLNSSDLAELDPLLKESLGSFAGLLCGVTVTVAPRVVADRERWMQWWTPGPQQLIPDLDATSAGYYDYTTADWYRTPLRSGREYLSDPYFDKGGADAWIVTASVPVFVEGKSLGVTTADIDLEAVARLCLPALRGLTSPAALLSRSGVVVTSTDPDRLKVGVIPDADLHGWVLRAEGTHVSRADGVRLSRVPTLDWSLLEFGDAPGPETRHLAHADSVAR